MSVVANNLKLIRKTLNCNQTAMAQILGTGFRTYVRYEAAERDAPATLLVKMAHLGNVSLDELLTSALTKDDLQLEKPGKNSKEPPTLISGSPEEGRIQLKGYHDDFLLTTSKEENGLLNHFRKLSASDKKKCQKRLDQSLATSEKESQTSTSTKSAKKKNAARVRKVARSAKRTTLR